MAGAQGTEGATIHNPRIASNNASPVRSSAPDFLSVSLRCSWFIKKVWKGPDCRLRTPCQAQKHGPKSKPQYRPQSVGLVPSRPICWPTREGDKSMFGPPTKVQECLSPSHTGRRRSWGATGRRGTGRTGERTHTGTLRQGCLEVPSQVRVWLDRGVFITWLLSPFGNIC